MDHLFTCSCGEVLVKSSYGITKIRNKIMVFRDGLAYAVCPGCGQENNVPVRLTDNNLEKSVKRPKLFLQSTKKIIDIKIPKS